MGGRGKGLGPPRGAARWIFTAEPGLGAQGERGRGCWGGQSSAPVRGGSGWPCPPRSLQQHWQHRRAKPWLQHLPNAARCHLPVCSGGRIHGAEGLRPPPTLPRTPRIVPRLVFLAPACKPCPASLRLAALPHRASPGPGERVRSSGGAWGVLEQTWPPGAKHAVGAGVRPLQMAAPQTLAWRSHGTVTSPQGPRREPHLPCDREGAIPTQNAPRMQVCPCPLQPKHQGTGRARMAAGSQIRAVSRQRRWPNNSGKRPRMWF